MTFNLDVQVFVESLGPAASAALAQAARETQVEVESQQEARRGIRPLTHEATDGVADKPYEEVKPNGIIFEYWDYRVEIVEACFEELKARSPVVSGKYRDSHFCLVDGEGLPPLTLPTQEQASAATRLTVTNPLPYARKLEVGLTESGETFAKQVDPHIFESAMEAVRRDFKDVAALSFGYIDLAGAYVLLHDNAREMKRRRKVRADHRAGAAIRYPAIFIDPV